MDWTQQQKKVIGLRDRSMLVSASAGAGKTAVLVQRIIAMVTDPDRRMDVDELLVVTFTNAAAAEMRRRVLQAIEEAAREDPSDEHLQRQPALIHHAQITTIDSFCLHVVRNHFHRINLEPGFRIADEGELTLLREDVCDAVLERFYGEREENFLRFAEAYSTAKSDKPIRDMILRLYDFSQSYPWPEEWLSSCASQYEADSVEELEKKRWVADFLDYLSARVEEMIRAQKDALCLTTQPDGPRMYEEAIRDDIQKLEGLSGCGNLAGWKETLDAIRWKRLSSARGYEGSEEKQEAVKESRARMKKQVGDIRRKYFSTDLSAQAEAMGKVGAMVGVLVDLTRAFSVSFAGAKEEKNMADFSDVEHYALRILVDPDTKQPTETAAEYREKIREVMIDEYQDSNYVQEEILTAVSGIPEGRENLFMVGDVKQSIYRFRLARPELFMEKYNTFSEEDGRRQRVDLRENFRSRGEVLDAVNDIFGHIMGHDLGNVEYDEGAALCQGREFLPYEKPECCRTECLLVGEDPAGRDRRVTEARAIAQRIRAMVADQEIPGKRYGDVVILLRTLTGWAEAFQTAFEQEGIPLIVASRTGYFSAREVQVTLNLLRVIDNPGQDIPLASVMRSPIGDFSAAELAKVRLCAPSLPFFSCVSAIAAGEARAQKELARKVGRFWKMLETFRERVPYTPIHALLLQIYEETGYRAFVTALPAGEQRRANLDMLLEKALAYEKTSYHGLFHFVRYIDRLMRYRVDYGEAETVSERENAVRLMTIHKSKGLEFSVVFVAGMAKRFNMQDANSAMIFHSEYGVGLKWADPERRIKTDTLIRRIFSLETRRESLGEELRILYVALTRAREKLVIVGMERESGKQKRELSPYEKLDFTLRMDAGCFWDWVLPALCACGGRYPLTPVRFEERLESEKKRQEGMEEAKNRLSRELEEVDADIARRLEDRLSWRYPFEKGIAKKQKVSVSEIKKNAVREARGMTGEDAGEEWFPGEAPVPCIPKFVRGGEENTGALRGTALHRFLECVDFSELSGQRKGEGGRDFMREMPGELIAGGRISPKEEKLLNFSRIRRFLSTDIAARMGEAARRGQLTREQPFVLSLPASRVFGDADSGKEPVLVQGIIDVFWEEEDGLVLLDYKTDRVDQATDLLLRYREQMLFYAEALGRSFPGKKVKECLIYSFHLGRFIPVEP